MKRLWEKHGKTVRCTNSLFPGVGNRHTHTHTHTLSHTYTHKYLHTYAHTHTHIRIHTNSTHTKVHQIWCTKCTSVGCIPLKRVHEMLHLKIQIFVSTNVCWSCIGPNAILSGSLEHGCGKRICFVQPNLLYVLVVRE